MGDVRGVFGVVDAVWTDGEDDDEEEDDRVTVEEHSEEEEEEMTIPSLSCSPVENDGSPAGFACEIEGRHRGETKQEENEDEVEEEEEGGD